MLPQMILELLSNHRIDLFLHRLFYGSIDKTRDGTPNSLIILTRPSEVFQKGFLDFQLDYLLEGFEVE